MNIDKLKQAEADLLQNHPMGFDDPEFQKMGKKHQMPLLQFKARDSSVRLWLTQNDVFLFFY